MLWVVLCISQDSLNERIEGFSIQKHGQALARWPGPSPFCLRLFLQSVTRSWLAGAIVRASGSAVSPGFHIPLPYWEADWIRSLGCSHGHHLSSCLSSLGEGHRHLPRPEATLLEPGSLPSRSSSCLPLRPQGPDSTLQVTSL